MSQPAPLNEEFRRQRDRIIGTLKDAPERLLDELRAIREESPDLVPAFEEWLAPAMRWARRGQMIRRGAAVLPRLAMAYTGAREDDRRILIHNAVPILFALDASHPALHSIAAMVEPFVLGGAPQQLFIADLAGRIGQAPDLSEGIRDFLAKPLIRALTSIVEVGAPAMRDASLEGLGALLKHFPDRGFTFEKLDDHAATEGDCGLNLQYDTLRRTRERIALAIAGRAEAVQQVRESLHCADLVIRAEYVRALPALLRQGVLDSKEVIERMCIAASATVAEPDASVRVRTELARHQESVFRTLDVLLARGLSARPFDTVVASAVKAIPTTLLGALELCNAQSRATVTVLTTAARVAATLRKSKTDAALKEHYKHIGEQHTVWTNPGIIEGCFRALPVLLWDHENDDWTDDAVTRLFQSLAATPERNDLVAMHARLSANAAFRQILLALNERMQQHVLTSADHDPTTQTRNADRAMRDLLANPSADLVKKIFAKDGFFPGRDTARNVSEIIVSATDMETTLLHHADALFVDWRFLSDAEQLLVVRILGAQLRSASHERVQIERYRIVKQVLRRLSAVTMSDADRDEMLWELLSRIPARAAEAAEADLQEFVEFRAGQTGLVDDDVNDLPGYVLAMISPDVTERLAADIARQVDLNIHRTKGHHDFDFTDTLYQITLRDPGQAIYDHLLARITDPHHRQSLLLFREHVIAVNECMPQRPGDRVDVDGLVKHAEALGPRLRWRETPALRDLSEAMRLFATLAAEKPAMWNAIVGREKGLGGGLGALFVLLDRLDQETRHRNTVAQRLRPERSSRRRRRRDHPQWRPRVQRLSLEKLCREDYVQLQLDVEHYLRLPVGNFDECNRALRSAMHAVRSIREKVTERAGLQPPEQIILEALLDRWEDIFDRTIQWYVDAPRRFVHGRRKELFFNSFTNVIDKYRPKPKEAPSPMHLTRLDSEEVPKVKWPPIPPGQDVAFENFFVQWMASDLDVDNLQWALSPRWGRFGFRFWYGKIINLLFTSTLIALPFGLTAFLHYKHLEEIEGVGFFVYVVALLALTLVTLIVRARKELTDAGSRPYYPFRFAALLPRLFRLMVIPIFLLIDFEHSYLFPMHATDVVLVGLLLLALVSTEFFIRRALRSTEGELSRLDDRDLETDINRRVRQVLSIALVHAFVVALFFSFLFESRTIHRAHVADRVHAMAMNEHVMADDDGHNEPLFLSYVPREARFNVNWIAHQTGYRLEPLLERSLDLHFYPTLILSWTALGLFFGVFLEGFLKGERLRGEIGS